MATSTKKVRGGNVELRYSYGLSAASAVTVAQTTSRHHFSILSNSHIIGTSAREKRRAESLALRLFHKFNVAAWFGKFGILLGIKSELHRVGRQTASCQNFMSLAPAPARSKPFSQLLPLSSPSVIFCAAQSFVRYTIALKLSRRELRVMKIWGEIHVHHHHNCMARFDSNLILYCGHNERRACVRTGHLTCSIFTSIASFEHSFSARLESQGLAVFVEWLRQLW